MDIYSEADFGPDETIPPPPFDAGAGNEDNNHKTHLLLSLHIEDSGLISELERYTPGAERDSASIAALRYGLPIVRETRDRQEQIQFEAIAQKLIQNLDQRFVTHTDQVLSRLTDVLSGHFDPTKGSFMQQLSEVAGKDGELEQVLKQYLSGNDSMLSRSISGQLEPVFKLLSPTDTQGLRFQIEKTILGQFSTEDPNTVMGRFFGQLKRVIDGGGADVAEQVRLLKQELSFDHKESSINRLKHELKDEHKLLVDEVVKITEVIRGQQIKRELSLRTPIHGLAFQEQLGHVLGEIAQKKGDAHDDVSRSVGVDRTKIGDFVEQLGDNNKAAHAKIVFEAKEEKGYSIQKALDELDSAMSNRCAQVGVFVFSKRVAPLNIDPIARYGHRLIVVWDSEDPSTDLVVEAAYCFAVMLAAYSGENCTSFRRQSCM